MSWDCSTVLLELVQKSQEERIGVESSSAHRHSAVPHRISLNFEMKGCHRDRDLKRVALPRRVVRLLKKVSHLRNASLRQLEISCISNS